MINGTEAQPVILTALSTELKLGTQAIRSASGFLLACRQLSCNSLHAAIEIQCPLVQLPRRNRNERHAQSTTQNQRGRTGDYDSENQNENNKRGGPIQTGAILDGNNNGDTMPSNQFLFAK